MTDAYVLLTPVLLLGVIALAGFVGCDQVFGLDRDDPGPPDPPTNLVATLADAAVVLEWDQYAGAEEFSLLRGTEEGQYDFLKTVTPPDHGHRDTDPTNGIRPHYAVQVKNAHGTSGVSNDAAPLAAFVYEKTPGLKRNLGFTGWAGMQIEVGPTPVTILKLGRIVVPGNIRTHEVKVVKVNIADPTMNVDLVSVPVDTTSPTIDGFAYEPLSNTVPLTPGGIYYVVSYETDGGDEFHDSNTTVTSTSAATVKRAIYQQGMTGPWDPSGTINMSYGPVNFQY